MYPSGDPNQPGPYLPPTGQQPTQKPQRHVALRVIGWILIAFGGIGALSSLFTGDGVGGKIGGLLIGLAIAALGALLVWPINWKIGVPAAVAALILGGAVTPTKVEPTPATAVAPASSSTTTTTTTAPSSSVPTTSSSAPSTTTTTTTEPTTTTTTARATTTTVDPPPAVQETNTRTPVPTPQRVVPTTEYTPPPAPPVRTQRRYTSCADARAAGAAPLYPSSPGWNPALDRDDDGVACE